MSLAKMSALVLVAATTTMMTAQETGIQVRAVRVLANDPESLAVFYEKAFGMSEIRRPVNSPTVKEIVVNSGSTVELAKKATGAPIVILTRPKDAPAGAIASLILQVPDMNRAIESVTRNGGTLFRAPKASSSGNGNTFAFVKDPDGNQIELLMSPK